MYTVTVDSMICAAYLPADEFTATIGSAENNKTMAFPMAVDMGFHLYVDELPSTSIRRHNVHPPNNNSHPGSLSRYYCL